jgi:hypothetical protein
VLRKYLRKEGRKEGKKEGRRGGERREEGGTGTGKLWGDETPRGF